MGPRPSASAAALLGGMRIARYLELSAVYEWLISMPIAAQDCDAPAVAVCGPAAGDSV